MALPIHLQSCCGGRSVVTMVDCVTLCARELSFGGAVSVVESSASSCDGAGSIPTAYMAPLPKQNRRRHSCCERLARM